MGSLDKRSKAENYPSVIDSSIFWKNCSKTTIFGFLLAWVFYWPTFLMDLYRCIKGVRRGSIFCWNICGTLLAQRTTADAKDTISSSLNDSSFMPSFFKASLLSAYSDKAARISDLACWTDASSKVAPSTGMRILEQPSQTGHLYFDVVCFSGFLEKQFGCTL